MWFQTICNMKDTFLMNCFFPYNSDSQKAKKEHKVDYSNALSIVF